MKTWLILPSKDLNEHRMFALYLPMNCFLLILGGFLFDVTHRLGVIFHIIPQQQDFIHSMSWFHEKNMKRYLSEEEEEEEEKAQSRRQIACAA